MNPQQPPLSLYIHLPWCVQKCPYCDFNSHKAGARAPRDRYVAALLKDLHSTAPLAADRDVVSIFLGGGTPSLFSPAQIEEILQQASLTFALGDDCEITMEANPGTIERGNLAAYRRAGVNRLSLGAQSFDAKVLQALGRIHGPDEILTAYDEATEAGFNSINIDLMFALPGQNRDQAVADIEKMLQLSPQHISYYQLTLEPNTIFHSRPPANIPDDDASWEIQMKCHALLEQSGYEQYEISAFAKPGFRCRHNLNYWSFGDYLAAGAGAHGKHTDRQGDIWRYQRPANPLAYMEAIESGDTDTGLKKLDGADIGFEFMLNALRMTAGFSEITFLSRTGLSIADVSQPIEGARNDGLIERSGNGVWRPTASGFRFLNELQARFLP
jgi:oxygen-independent coproporphyrinogen-3 oxidase